MVLHIIASECRKSPVYTGLFAYIWYNIKRDKSDSKRKKKLGSAGNIRIEILFVGRAFA